MRSGTLLALILIIFIISPVSIIGIQGESMEPTIPDGSLVFSYQTDSISTNDVINFYSPEQERYVTHRVVGIEEEGYITLGDNNTVRDQRVGFEPVTNDQIQSKVLYFQNSPVYLPYVGSYILQLRSNILPIALLGIGLLFAVSYLSNRVSSKRRYAHLTARDILQPIFVVTFGLMVAVFILSSTTVPISFVYSSSPVASENPEILQVGETDIIEDIYVETNSNFYTQQLYVSKGFNILEVSEGQPTLLVADMPTKNTSGVLATQITVYKIPKVLPTGLARSLAQISPAIPVVLSAIILITPFYLIYLFVIGPNTPIREGKFKVIFSKLGL